MDSVTTYPVGIGQQGRSTPMGEMSVERKAVRPTWDAPASTARIIRRGVTRSLPKFRRSPNPAGRVRALSDRASYVIMDGQATASVCAQPTGVSASIRKTWRNPIRLWESGRR